MKQFIKKITTVFIIILAVIITLGVGVGVLENQSRQQQIRADIERDKEVQLQKEEEHKKQELTRCLDGAREAFNKALSKADSTQYTEYSNWQYIQSVNQLHQTFIADCQARYGQ